MMEKIKRFIKWVRIDGLLHIETVYMIVMLVFAFLRLLGSHDFAIFMGFAVGMAVSVGKEIWDEFHTGHKSEDHDLYCDFIGAGLALITMFIVHG